MIVEEISQDESYNMIERWHDPDDLFNCEIIDEGTWLSARDLLIRILDPIGSHGFIVGVDEFYVGDNPLDFRLLNLTLVGQKALRSDFLARIGQFNEDVSAPFRVIVGHIVEGYDCLLTLFVDVERVFYFCDDRPYSEWLEMRIAEL